MFFIKPFFKKYLLFNNNIFNNDIFINIFYRKLKNIVKNEIIIYDKPGIFDKYAALGIKIDN